MLFPSLLVSESANESHLVHLQVQFLVLFWSQCRCNVSSFWVLLEVFCRLIHICIQGTFCIWLTFFGSRHTLKLVSQSQCTTAKFVTADEVANAMNQGCATNVPAHLGNHMNLRTCLQKSIGDSNEKVCAGSDTTRSTVTFLWQFLWAH